MDGVQLHRIGMAAALLMVGGLLTLGDIAHLTAADPPKTINVRVVDKAGYDKVIAANKGKVIVVDCWATWCVPCRKAFPKTIELSKTYADQDVVVVTLCFDEVVKGRTPEKVNRFLAVNEAYCENLISSLDIGDTGADEFGIPEGILPHFKVYGKDGKLFKAFESGEGKEFTHEDVEDAVKRAIKAKTK